MGRIGLLCCFGSSKNGSVSTLVRKRQWNILHERLKGPSEQMRAEMMNIDESGDTILHAICRCHPPRELMQDIIAILPDTTTAKNQSNQYALHIAAENGASPHIIRYLCNLQPIASGSRDNSGRTPLHLVCKNYAIKYKPYKDISMTDAMLQSVRTIIDLSPETVNIDDQDGMTALEYAIEANADIRTIQSIQKACERGWKVKKNKSRSSNLSSNSPTIRRRTTRRNSFTKGPDSESLLTAALETKKSFGDNGNNSSPTKSETTKSPQDVKDTTTEKSDILDSNQSKHELTSTAIVDESEGQSSTEQASKATKAHTDAVPSENAGQRELVTMEVNTARSNDEGVYSSTEQVSSTTDALEAVNTNTTTETTNMASQ